MNLQEFQKLSSRTYPDSKANHAIGTRIQSSAAVDLLHASIGITTEAGELMDCIKKFAIYGKEFNYENFREELGDLLSYIALACNSCGFKMEDICEENIAKLKIRYPEKFSEADATERKDKIVRPSTNKITSSFGIEDMKKILLP